MICYVSTRPLPAAARLELCLNVAHAFDRLLLNVYCLAQLSAVGLDVFPNEPEVNPRLLQFPQATLLPHMGTETQESQKKMEIRALTNLRDYLIRGYGTDVVPELKDMK